jgi:hypothetical protein
MKNQYAISHASLAICPHTNHRGTTQMLLPNYDDSAMNLSLYLTGHSRQAGC